jgi:alanine racemase
VSGRLQIDLTALAHNYQVLHGGRPETLSAVVKADAYGLGANQIAETLWQQGCREFFVAQASEGVTLRSDPADRSNIRARGRYAAVVDDVTKQ